MPAESLPQQFEDDLNLAQINLFRIEAGQRKEVIRILEDLEKELVQKLQNEDLTSAKKKKLEEFKSQTESQIESAYKQITFQNEKGLEGVAKITTAQTAKSIDARLGILVSKRLTEGQLENIARGPFIQGNRSSEWWAGQSESLKRNFGGQVQMGLLNGEDMDSIVRRIRGTKAANFTDGVMTAKKHEAEALVRTSLASIANQSRIDTIIENPEVAKGISWVSTLDGRTTTTCFDGSTRVAPIGKIMAIHRRRFEGEMIIITAASGKQLAVTPNHPILTTNGWKRAKELTPSDQMINAFGTRGVEVSEQNKVHPTFSAIADALFDPAVSKIRKECSTTADFHGDGKRGDEQIEIACPKSLLGDGFNPYRKESIEHKTLAWLHNTGAFLSDSGLGALRFRQEVSIQTPKVASSTVQRRVKARTRNSLQSDDFRGAHAAFKKFDTISEQSGGFSPDGFFPNSKPCQEGRDGGGGCPILFSDGSEAIPISVEVENIVDVRSELRSLHVYNFETTQGVYTAEGFIVKNCKSLHRLTWRLPDLKPVGHDKAFPGPIAHWGCRSSQVPETYTWEELSGKSLKVDKKSDTYRNHFEARLKKQGFDDKEIAEIRADQQESMDGQVSKDGGWEGWLKSKGEAFARETLGPTRAKLWQEGKLTLRDLTDQQGRELTIDELLVAIEGGSFPKETEGAQFLPAPSSKISPLSEKAEDEAFQKLTDYLENPEGQTLKSKFAKKVDSVLPEATSLEKIAWVDAQAATAQEAASKASTLSGAKKKLISGKPMTPKQKEVYDGLEPEEKEAFDEAVKDKQALKQAEESQKIAEAAKLQAEKEKADAELKAAKKAKKLEELENDPSPSKASASALPDPKSLTFIESLPGSTSPELREDEAGKRWVVKSKGDPDHLKNEALADQLYRISGARVPKSGFIDIAQGGPVKISEFLAEAQTLGAWERTATESQKRKIRKELQDHFVMDSLLANWDVAGQLNDNILISGGKAYRVDNGGSLSFRAQGARKTPGQWNEEVGELVTLRDRTISAGNTAEIFEGISTKQINDQIEAIYSNRLNLIAEVRKTAGPEEAEIFSKRIDWLESQLPASLRNGATKAQGAARERAVASLADYNLGQLSQDVKTSRINGKSIPLGAFDIEDAQALIWEERDQNGNPVTLLNLKLTDQGSSKALSKILEQDPQQLSSTTVHPEDEGFNTIFWNHAKTLGHHHSDKAYNLATIKTSEDALKKVQANLKAEQAKKTPDPAKVEMLTHYQEIGLKLKKATESKAIPPLIQTDPWNFDAKKYQAEKPPSTDQAFKAVQGNQFSVRENKIENGFAESSGKQALIIESKARNFALDFDDGSKLDFMERLEGLESRSGLSFEGGVTVKVLGPVDGEAIRKAVEKLELLNVTTRPPNADEKEFLWLSKTVEINSDQNDVKWKKVLSISDDRERARAAREFAEKAYGPIPKRGSADYQIEETDSFGNGRFRAYRADLTRSKIEKDPELSKIRLYHHPYENKVAKVAEAFLNSGGEATSTVERVRKGVNVTETGGKSPHIDIGTGGSSYFFTRIRNGEEADSATGFYFKARNLARADAITYRRDNYGKISQIGTRESKKEDYLKIMERGETDETLLKNGLSFIDEIDTIRVRSEDEKKEVLQIFKKAGLKTLPDGRKIEDIVLTL